MTGGVALLERAVTYTLGSLRLVTPQAMVRPTPCAEWDLRALLVHMDDSLIALSEAAEIGRVDLDAASGQGGDLVGVLRDRACRLLGAWTNAEGRDLVSVGGCPMTAALLTGVGAIEIAVHGWDVARACGEWRPIPSALSVELLQLAPTFVTPVDRPGRFAVPLEVGGSADPSARLLAFLGRTDK